MTNKSSTAEEVREYADRVDGDSDKAFSLRHCAKLLYAYADMLERPVYSANPHTLADFVTLPDAERMQIGKQVAARVDAMMDRPADSGRVTDERATFEAWVSKRHGAPLGRWADSGKYQYDNTNAWWECWQAALAAQGQGQGHDEPFAWAMFNERGEYQRTVTDREEKESLLRHDWMPVIPQWTATPLYTAPPASPAGVPDGYVLVPREPTENMVVDGFESEPDPLFMPDAWPEYEAMTGCQQAAHRARLCWAAMIAGYDRDAAAPSAQGQGEPWQPMNTAPRDGTVIELRWGEDGTMPGWWSCPVSPMQFADGTWPREEYGHPWSFIDTNDGRAFVNMARDNEYGPTHWRRYTPASPAGVPDGLPNEWEDWPGPSDDDDWRDYGYMLGWNAFRSAMLAAATSAPEGASPYCPACRCVEGECICTNGDGGAV